MSKKKDTLTMIDLGGTASGIGLIPRRITLKDNEFDQFIQNISLSKTTMSKDQDLVSLTMSILDKPPRRYKLDTDGFFKEDQEQINTWEEYFKLFDNPKGLEDFMADREQDTPKDRNQAYSLRQFQFLMLWISFVMWIKKSRLKRKW